MKLSKNRSHLLMGVRGTVLLVAACLLGITGCQFGVLSTTPETPEPTVVEDPWEREAPDPVFMEGFLDETLVGLQFPVEGVLDGQILFGYQSQGDALIVRADGTGTTFWAYRFPEGRNPQDIRLLPSGNILCQLGGNGIYEISPEGEVVWYFLDQWNSHHAQRLENGNTIIVECGRSYAYEIDREGNKVWEWDARTELLEYTGETFIGLIPPLSDVDKMVNAYGRYSTTAYGSSDWTHINTAYRTEESTTILCLRNLDLLLEVDIGNNVVWTFGPLVLKHPHCAVRLGNGNTLVFDNGNGRVIEVAPNHEIVWESLKFDSPVMGGCQRLPNGNTLICVSQPSGGLDPYVMVVTPENEVVWKLTVPKSGENWTLEESPFGGPYRAWWYPNGE